MPAALPWGRGTASPRHATSSTLIASAPSSVGVGMFDVNSDP